MAPSWCQWLACLVALLALSSPLPVTAQLLQDYGASLPIRLHNLSDNNYFWKPRPGGGSPDPVINIRPRIVWLVYNCYYMRDICKNADNFEGTARGKNLHPTSGLPNDIFGYDFFTGKSSQTHQSLRREQSCPTRAGNLGWSRFHTCPEDNQRTVMRHDGPWWSTLLDPQGVFNEILRNPILGRSKMRYTCDEFPPATWVEGGNGVDGNTPAQTRCAALSCDEGGKSEQNWQALAHAKLRTVLEDAIAEINRTAISLRLPQPFPTYDKRSSIVLFRFVRTTRADNIAARVWEFGALDSLGPITKEFLIEQKMKNSKRSEALAAANFPRSLSDPSPTYEVLAQLVQQGFAREELVHANHTGAGSGDDELPSATYHHDHGDGPDGPVGLGARWDHNNYNNAQVVGNATCAAAHAPQPRMASRFPLWRRNSTVDESVPPLLRNVSSTELKRARAIVLDAIAESGRLNKARLANPLRNNYELKPGTITGAPSAPAPAPAPRRLRSRARPVAAPAPPLLQITDEIAKAAALVAEADAAGARGRGLNQTLARRQSSGPGTYWMAGLARKGRVPWGNDPSYNVFRNVRDYGAVGDGVTDDTEAIKFALMDGHRCGANCNGATTKNAIVYLPPGTYLISTTVPLPFGTQLIGDANDRPILLASTSFVGLGVLSVNEYTGGGVGTDGLEQQWYVNTANFYRQLRNLVIDVTPAPPGEIVACIHYQVAQATSTQNVELIAGPGQMGMFAENGSGGQISDMTFTGGDFGIYGGSQQFTAQRLTFNGCGVGVRTIWDWGWVWKSVTMTGVGVGFKLVPEGTTGNVGSAALLDSSFTDVDTVVLITPPTSVSASGTTGLVLERVKLSSVGAAVADTAETVLLAGTNGVVDHWVLGPVYSGSASSRTFSSGGRVGSYRRDPSLLDISGAYFERPKPQYEGHSVSDFLHARDFGATGDGSTDDTAALQSAIYASQGQGKILFVDAGSYILTSTVTIPSGSRIVGETWSQLVASGPGFSNANSPRALIRVGEAGEVGSVELQDLMFTTRGPTAGAVLVEWNIQADSPGSAALWDCHVRIGGAEGTYLTPSECPPVTSGVVPCNAASLMMHVTPSASGYFENMWLWVADHMIDDPDLVDANNTMVQTSIYVARGLLVESTEATWLYGTSSEHAVFYQYNFHKASHIFAGMIQTESPYYQPTPPPPAPFAANVGVFPGDPSYACASGNEFSGCDESWAVIIRQCSKIFVASAGLYSWFSTYEQTCIAGQLCQKALVLLDSNHASVRFQHLITIGAKYMAVMNGVGIPAAANLNVNSHPFWSQISILDVASDGSQFDDVLWIDPSIWDMEQPQFTCSPPCTVKIPPWTGATSTLDYPRITVSAGTWTSTITKPPMTVSQWMFKPVTISAGGGLKKRGSMDKREAVLLDEFIPPLETTSRWPVVRYLGPDGLVSTASPTGPIPPPPPTTVAPAGGGSWPTLAIMAVAGLLGEESPTVAPCNERFWDLSCQAIWIYEAMSSTDPYVDENWQELQTMCLPTTTSSSRTTQPTPTPTPSPRVHPDPGTNDVECYNDGEGVKHVTLDDAFHKFCNHIGEPGDVLVSLPTRDRSYARAYKYPEDIWTGIGVDILVQLYVKKSCEWPWNYAECRRYLNVVADSCNCGGVNGKQGGVVENNCLIWRGDTFRYT